MKFVLNGAIVQGKQETNYLNIPKVKYTGIHAYYHDPLSDVADIDLRRIADQAMIKKYNDGVWDGIIYKIAKKTWKNNKIML